MQQTKNAYLRKKSLLCLYGIGNKMLFLQTENAYLRKKSKWIWKSNVTFICGNSLKVSTMG